MVLRLVKDQNGALKVLTLGMQGDTQLQQDFLPIRKICISQHHAKDEWITSGHLPTNWLPQHLHHNLLEGTMSILKSSSFLT
ncbi:hypothetical protein WJ35_05330 [Burkholderia ubonensis]|uniref:Uncharacterized protein n=1 Tax=Burkholderia ubonensis TaxID=101571 RepID=A0A1B4LBL1_9BURK|nr:hypothetical protein WJ35_05330 [Burkholderia ubonensis]AOK09868.1 hypothetical protein WK31_06180 [Burkholderia vietnamiensis]KVE22817.1 hypothetical protein WI92_21255 [Burkholderia vietnamiensis]KVF09003.1 hypothetical protein WJ04_09245 [Burkholderia vietnamiensis]